MIYKDLLRTENDSMEFVKALAHSMLPRVSISILKNTDLWKTDKASAYSWFHCHKCETKLKSSGNTKSNDNQNPRNLIDE